MTTTSPPTNQVYVFPASHAQRGLWFLEQLAPGSALYNLHKGNSIWSEVDAPRLAAALSAVVDRHEALRTAFRSMDGEPVQVVAPAVEVPLPVTDLRHIADADASEPFDLGRWPLLRARLVRMADDHHVFLLTIHHICCDYWSLEIFQDELATLYAAYCDGAEPGDPDLLPELAIQYPDFSEWERRWLAGPEGTEQLDWWRDRLADAATLRLPADRARPPEPSYAGAAHDFEIPPPVHAGLARLGQQERATLFMVTLAAFQALLHRWCGQDDVVVGTPVANRNRADAQDLIGYLVNALVL